MRRSALHRITMRLLEEPFINQRISFSCNMASNVLFWQKVTEKQGEPVQRQLVKSYNFNFGEQNFHVLATFALVILLSALSFLCHLLSVLKYYQLYVTFLPFVGATFLH